jgi:hypothetical protein
MQLKKGDKIAGRFDLWMMILMVAWSISEVIEDSLPTPVGDPVHYLHLVVMSFFPVFFALRWRWVSNQVRKRNERPSDSPTVPA